MRKATRIRHRALTLIAALAVAVAGAVPTAASASSSPPLCAVTADFYTGGTPPTTDERCVVDTFKLGEGVEERAGANLTISAPAEITLGKPFTLSVHSPDPICVLTDENFTRPCIYSWATYFRKVTNSYGASPLTFAPTSKASSRECAGGFFGDSPTENPGAPYGNASLSCMAEVKTSERSFNPAGAWYAIGIAVTGGTGIGSLEGELELPVRIRR